MLNYLKKKLTIFLTIVFLFKTEADKSFYLNCCAPKPRVPLKSDNNESMLDPRVNSTVSNTRNHRSLNTNTNTNFVDPSDNSQNAFNNINRFSQNQNNGDVTFIIPSSQTNNERIRRDVNMDEISAFADSEEFSRLPALNNPSPNETLNSINIDNPITNVATEHLRAQHEALLNNFDLVFENLRLNINIVRSRREELQEAINQASEVASETVQLSSTGFLSYIPSFSYSWGTAIVFFGFMGFVTYVAYRRSGVSIELINSSSQRIEVSSARMESTVNQISSSINRVETQISAQASQISAQSSQISAQVNQTSAQSTEISQLRLYLRSMTVFLSVQSGLLFRYFFRFRR